MYLSNLKDRKNEEQISSLDITPKQKCFIIKVKKKYENYYPEEKGGIFYTYLKNFKSIKKNRFIYRQSRIWKRRNN